MLIARLAGEGHVPQAEHVKRGNQRPRHRGPLQEDVLGILAAKAPSLFDDRVFRVVAAQAEYGQRNARPDDRQTACEHRVGGDRHFFPEAAHLGHVVGVYGMDHRSRAEEQQALEEGVRNQMEHPGDPAAQAEREHHVAQLADGRVGQHPLDVDGRNGDRRRNQQRDAAGVGDHQQRLGREHRIEPADQIDAGGDHRGGVHQRGDRRGAFHRVGQPGVQRELGALAHAAAEDADPGDQQQPLAGGVGV